MKKTEKTEQPFSTFDKVIAFMEKADGAGKLSESQKKLIRGQREINFRLYNAIEKILDNLSPSPSKTVTEVSQSLKELAKLKDEWENVLGKAPPGCGL